MACSVTAPAPSGPAPTSFTATVTGTDGATSEFRPPGRPVGLNHSVFKRSGYRFAFQENASTIKVSALGCGRTFPPSRIVCLTEETVETLYLLGEDARIVGVSGYAVRPPQVRT